ncbi:MAG: sugar ABC transporter permease [Bacilli bacterium]|nr:sugar ABC transporter permease [Bacilli bacterium]
MTKIEYLSLSKGQRAIVRVAEGFKNFGLGFVGFFRKLPSKFTKMWMVILSPFYVLKDALINGNWITRANFLVCGFSQLFRKQIARGILYLLYEVVFFWFLFKIGVPNFAKLGTLGEFGPNATYLVFNATTQEFMPTFISTGDFSFNILLYSLITIVLMIIFVVLWFFSIRDAKLLQDSESVGKFSKNSDFVKDITGKSYQNVLLAIPMVGLLAFTIIPIIFMIIIGFTNYTSVHTDLFDWVGFKNYSNLFGGASDGANDIVQVFFKVLAWTLIWAFFATFTNYFLGMVVALLINKKGIKLKKLWRTVLITTIAVPQFVSLLLISQMFSGTGIVSRLFMDWGIIQPGFELLSDPLISKIIIIVVNMWVGIPYTMLICSGILMNIPEDLYESARIDGATPFKMYMKITLPYMLFITMPYLISQFVGNINNFNVIYLLTGGGPEFKLAGLTVPAQYGNVGQTDLLITWIYKICMNDQKDYASASVIGVLIFLVVAIFSFIFYGRSNSVKNEEDFQ